MAGESAKKPYQKPYLKPQLTVHGSLAEITRTTECYEGGDDGGSYPAYYLSGTGPCGPP